MSHFSTEQFEALIQWELPWAAEAGMRALEIGARHARLLLPFNPSSLRPGNMVSGPAMMGLADAAMYAAVLGAIGEVKLAVTTNLNINFLQSAGSNDLMAEARVLKLGKRLVVLEVTLTAQGVEGAVAHATGTYSIPPRS